MAGQPVLWHIPISHYNEKARWALDYKGVRHERRAPPPPAHMAVSLFLTRGSAKTFPVLQLGGQVYGDSTEIIAALERLFPEPPLYPDDPEERSRALEIEDFFDEHVAPDVRLLAWHEAIKDPEAFGRFALEVVPPPMRRFSRRTAGPFATWFLKRRFGVASPDAAARARTRIEAGIDRLDAELADGREYLVGDRFSVADLTLAALVSPAGACAEYPYPQPQGEHASVEPLREALAESGLLEWSRDIYARHRDESAEVAGA
jgi:glutathione S-transferase